MTKPNPPVAKVQREETVLHGHTLTDDYRWLREKTNPDVIAYLNAENEYTDACLKHTEALQKQLYDEMLSHIKETDTQVPWRYRGYYYSTRWEKGRQYQIYERRKETLDAPAELMLDVNKLAEGQSFMAVRGLDVSDDGRYLAYGTDNSGFRQYRLHIRDLETGADLPDRAEKTGSMTWAADNETLFYTVEDHAKRFHRVYRHKRGDDASRDVMVYEETDERFNVAVWRSRSGKYIFLETASHTTSEVHFLDAATPDAAFTVIAPREQDVEYYPRHIGDDFYIRTNDKGINFRIVAAPVTSPGRANWREVVPHDDKIMLESLEVFEKFYVLYALENGQTEFTTVCLETGAKQRIAFPEPAYSVRPATNREFKSTLFRYSYVSLVTPQSVYDFDFETGTSTLLKRTEVPGGYDASLYASERVWATARDGVQVPVSVIYRKDMKKQGENPLYIYAYGSYGALTTPYFSGNRLSLLDRGVVMCYAQIRGGGEMGKAWHDAGRMMNKMNTFTDFIDCAEYLVAHGYGARDNIAAEGGSAGGLLMGAICNLRPDLFRAVISHVAFVDVMNTMLDASLPLTVAEYEEWGNPNEKDAFEYMRAYSPYDNLEAKDYPAMLVKTSLHDSQVMYWEPAKYVARLRTLKTDNNPLLLQTNMSAGHGGASGRYDYLKEVALDYAFLLWQMGIVKA